MGSFNGASKSDQTWTENKSFLEGIDNITSLKQSEEEVIDIVVHGDWRNRKKAVNLLGRFDYRTDILGRIAENDDREDIRREARKWLTNREEMIRIYEINQSDSDFGNVWDKLSQPVEAVVAVIDSDGYNTQLPRIGLSAKQMENLQISDKSDKQLDEEDLKKHIKHNKQGWLQDRDFGEVSVASDGKTVNASVYNASGPKSIGGPGVRISAKLASLLGLEEKDGIYLRKK